MKALVLLSMLFFSIVTSVASASPFEPGQLNPPALGWPVLRMRVAGGMPGPNGPVSSVMTLMGNGMVIFEKHSRQGVETVTYDGVVTPDQALEVNAIAGRISGGKLDKFVGPGCMDAPTSTYMKMSGDTEITFAQVMNCRPLYLKDPVQRKVAIKLAKYLDIVRQRVFDRTQDPK